MMPREKKADPVLPDQGGREMPGDPENPGREETVRRRAYELYERRGRKNGFDMQDWLDAEAQLVADSLGSQLIGPRRTIQ